MFKEEKQSRQLHFQSIKTRILALTLALLTAFTALPSQTAYAEVNGDGNSQGTGSGIGNTVGYGSGGFARNNTGYRFYLVDNNFNRVTDVYDYTFSTPKADVYITNSRFESISYDTSHWHWYNIDKLASMAQGTQNASAITSIYPITFDDQITKTFSVHGLDFRKWFIGNGGGSITSLGNTNRPGGSTSGGSRPGGSSGTSSGNNSGGGIKDYGDTYTDFSSLPPEIKSDVIRSTLCLSSDPFRWELSARQLNVATFQLKYGDEISKYTSKILRQNHINKEKYNKKNAMTNDQIKRAAAMQIIREQGESDHIKFIMSMIYNKISTSSVLSHTPSDLTTVSIPLAKDTSTAQQYPADAIMARAIFVPKGFNVDVTGDGTITGIDALRYKENGKFKYYLVVEPLLSIGVTNASGGLIKRVYGSYYNVNEYWARYANNDNAVKINKTLMKSVWKQSLIVDKSYPDLSRIKPVSTYSTSLSSMTISQNKQLMDDGIGLGLHIYCGSDFNESGTHTYDSLLGTTPGPAPDPSTLPDEPDKGGNTVVIIKNYVTETNGTEQTDGNYTRKQNPHIIEIEDEPNYKVVDWNTSTSEAPNIPNGSKTPWNDLIKTSTKTKVGNSSTTIELGNPEKVLYVKLKRTEGGSGKGEEVAGDWELNESELTKAVSTGSKTSNIKAVYTYGALNDCVGHDKGEWKKQYNEQTKTDDKVYVKWTDYCDFSITDNNYTFRRINSLEGSYSNIIAKTASFTSEINEIAGNRNGNLDAGQTEVSGFDYKFIIYRGSDKLNTCGYKPITDVNQLFDSATSKTKMTRLKTNYTKDIDISLVDASPDLQTSSSGSEGCNPTDPAKPLNNIDLAGTVAVKVYSGQPRTPDTSLDDTPLKVLTDIPTDKTAGRQVSSGGTITFNPYIRMTYQTLNSEKQDASVLSEYERTIIPNDYAEIKWTYTEGNLKIISQMFALDANLTKGDKEWNKKNQVLKGGATYSVTTPEPQKISLNTYQTITEGISRDNSRITGNELSEASAKLNHQQFVAEAIQTYNNTNVQQYVNKNTSAKTAWDNGVAVTNGSDISSLNNGSSTASTESKYYLKNDIDNKSNAARADLDVKEIGTKSTYYRFSSDTSGNIYMNKGDSVASVNSSKGDVILSKTQDTGSLSNGDAKTINLRTGVVDKLVAAIERNTGNDTTASWATSDGHWYNEAYEGVIVMVQSTNIEVKFDAVAKRTTVLDPKLIPKLNSTSGQNLTAFLTQYNTDLDSTTPIATFKGNEIYMKDANLLFNSNKVYITNSTVQQ